LPLVGGGGRSFCAVRGTPLLADICVRALSGGTMSFGNLGECSRTPLPCRFSTAPHPFNNGQGIFAIGTRIGAPARSARAPDGKIVTPAPCSKHQRHSTALSTIAWKRRGKPGRGRQSPRHARMGMHTIGTAASAAFLRRQIPRISLRVPWSASRASCVLTRLTARSTCTTGSIVDPSSSQLAR